MLHHSARSFGLVLLLFGSTPADGAHATYHRTLYDGAVRYELHYFPGGITAAEAKSRTGAYMVLPAGYFGFMKIGDVWRNDIVGYTMINNQTLASYLQIGRPIFAIRNQTTLDIFGSFKSFAAAGTSNYESAREADYLARDKTRKTGRSILARQGNKTHIFVMIGNDEDCRRRLKKNKLGSKFVFSDGGESLQPYTRNPCYLAVHRVGLIANLIDRTSL